MLCVFYERPKCYGSRFFNESNNITDSRLVLMVSVVLYVYEMYNASITFTTTCSIWHFFFFSIFFPSFHVFFTFFGITLKLCSIHSLPINLSYSVKFLHFSLSLFHFSLANDRNVSFPLTPNKNPNVSALERDSSIEKESDS